MKYFFSIVIGTILIFHSCSGVEDVPLSEYPFEELCVLSEPEGEPLGNIMSMDYVNDTSFVICTASQVYLYSFSGSLIRKIGINGRAQSEYIFPLIVRSDSRRIFVVDGMQLKIISYDLEGNPLSEVSYEKSFSDLAIDGDKLWLYTTLMDEERCIVKLDIGSGDTEVQDFLRYDGAHSVLNHLQARAPLALVDGVLWGMTRSRLELHRSDGLPAIKFKSKTFKVESVDDADTFSSDDIYYYLNENPAVLSILPDGDKMLVLTQEGYTKYDGAESDISHCYFSLYSVSMSNGDADCILRFPYMFWFSFTNMICGPHSFYFLFNHDNEDEGDSYCTLNRLILPAPSVSH